MIGHCQAVTTGSPQHLSGLNKTREPPTGTGAHNRGFGIGSKRPSQHGRASHGHGCTQSWVLVSALKSLAAWMTTFEHAMLGTTGALAVGLHRRSWQIVAMAGVAAVLPDWDGLSLLFGAAAFDQIHRAVGHSLWTATAVTILVALAEYRLRLMARLATLLGRWFDGLPADMTDLHGNNVREGVLVWTLTAVLATWSHLATDLVFSGHAQLSDWGLKLFWPFFAEAYVFPVVRWGDVLPTLIFVLGMFAMLRWRSHVQGLAALTLLAFVGYIAARAFLLPY